MSLIVKQVWQHAARCDIKDHKQTICEHREDCNVQILKGHQQNVRSPLTEQTVYRLRMHLNTSSKSARKRLICILSPHFAVTSTHLSQCSSASPDGRCYREHDDLLEGNSEQEWHASVISSVMDPYWETARGWGWLIWPSLMLLPFVTAVSSSLHCLMHC
jgi:hypothetical protein